MMPSPVKFSIFLRVSSKRGVLKKKKKKKSMDLLSFMSSFKCCKNFPLKINFSESNFLEVYAVVHYSGGPATSLPDLQVQEGRKFSFTGSGL